MTHTLRRLALTPLTQHTFVLSLFLTVAVAVHSFRWPPPLSLFRLRSTRSFAGTASPSSSVVNLHRRCSLPSFDCRWRWPPPKPPTPSLCRQPTSASTAVRWSQLTKIGCCKKRKIALIRFVFLPWLIPFARSEVCLPLCPIWILRLFFFPFVTEFIMAVCVDALFSPVTSIFVFYVCPKNNFVPENLCFRLCACWFVSPCHFGPPSSLLTELFARDPLRNGKHGRSSVTSLSHRLFGGFRFG